MIIDNSPTLDPDLLFYRNFQAKKPSATTPDSKPGSNEFSVSEKATNLLLSIIVHFLKEPTAAEAKSDSQEVLKKNPTFLDGLQISFDTFQQTHPETPLVWETHPQFIDAQKAKDLFNIFLKTASDITKGKIIAAIKNLMETQKPEKKFGPTSDRTRPKDLVETMFNAFKGTLNANGEGSLDLARGYGMGYDHRARRARIETLVEEVGRPLGVEEYFPIFLEDSKGNIGEALGKLTMFLKEAARDGTNATSFTSSETTAKRKVDNAEWMKAHIADQMAPFVSYQELEFDDQRHIPSNPAYEKVLQLVPRTTLTEVSFPNSSLENQIGKPYHAANILWLLQSFPPELVTLFVVGEYLKYGKNHGDHKALADALILQDLSAFNKKLHQYKKNGARDTSRP